MSPDLIPHKMPQGEYLAQSDFRKRSDRHISERGSYLKKRAEKASRKSEKKTPMSSQSAFETEADTPRAKKSRARQGEQGLELTPNNHDRTPASLTSQDREIDVGEQRFIENNRARLSDCTEKFQTPK